MKKLMFAAAALTAGFAMAEIVSSDIVGYAQSELNTTGAKMVTPQFLNIGSSTAMPLEAIVPAGDGVDDYCVEIQTLTPGGTTLASYTWIGGEWCDLDELPVSGVTVEAGSGLWVFDYTGGDCSLQTAGKVNTLDVDIALPSSGAVGVGNPFPTSVSLDDIVPVGDGVDDYCCEIQTLTPGGTTDASYTWIGGTWCDLDEEPVTGVSFEAGQGLWVFGYADDCALRFPAPEL